jgi:GTP-binding protein Era
VNVLLEELKKLMPEGPRYFPDDMMTDQPERLIIAEIVREKLLLRLTEEVPHGIAVTVERMKERKNIVDIEAVIYCEKESHKGIIIGKGGKMLKAVGIDARADIEKLLDCHVNLKLWVKVKEDWRNRENVIKNLGFD